MSLKIIGEKGEDGYQIQSFEVFQKGDAERLLYEILESGLGQEMTEKIKEAGREEGCKIAVDVADDYLKKYGLKRGLEDLFDDYYYDNDESNREDDVEGMIAQGVEDVENYLRQEEQAKIGQLAIASLMIEVTESISEDGAYRYKAVMCQKGNRKELLNALSRLRLLQDYITYIKKDSFEEGFKIFIDDINDRIYELGIEEKVPPISIEVKFVSEDELDADIKDMIKKLEEEINNNDENSANDNNNDQPDLG